MCELFHKGSREKVLVSARITSLAQHKGQLAEVVAALDVLDRDAAKTTKTFLAENSQILADGERRGEVLGTCLRELLRSVLLCVKKHFTALSEACRDAIGQAARRSMGAHRTGSGGMRPAQRPAAMVTH
jgi:hypothetical protein